MNPGDPDPGAADRNGADQDAADRDAEARDPGLQPERTALAWQRTGVSGALVGGLAVITAGHTSSLVVLGLTAVLAAGTAAAAGYASLPRRRRSVLPPSPWGRLLATAAIPLLLALSGVLIALS